MNVLMMQFLTHLQVSGQKTPANWSRHLSAITKKNGKHTLASMPRCGIHVSQIGYICDCILENRPFCHISYFEKYRF